MLVRCEHCGSALPKEATKCFVCGNEHKPFVPPPIPPELLNEIERMREKAQRKEKVLGKVMPWLILTSIISTIVSFIVMSNAGTMKGIQTSSIIAMSSLGAFVLFIFLWIVLVASDTAKIRAKEESIQATQRLPKPDEAEYERRIRDFISH